MTQLRRRKFLQSMLTASAIIGTSNLSFGNKKATAEKNTNRFKISLNAYSFNSLLTNKKTTLDELIEFCARENFDAIDMTGYYFPGYPQVPTDEYIYHLKNKAHRLGIAISGTGIRNEFGDPDKSKRGADIALVKNWIEVAAKLGAPVIRIFTAKTQTPGYTWEQQAAWIIEDIKTCAEHGKKFGVIVAVQNHNDFIKTADQAIDIIKKVNSEWFGLVLDTGSFVTNEPYSEIAKTTQYAVNWQVKEKLNYNGTSQDMDLEKLCRIIVNSSYRGYLPIETLSPGDAFQIVPPFLKLVRAALEKVMRT
jgi:sugar phosphate isomerase/epimerase